MSRYIAVYAADDDLDTYAKFLADMFLIFGKKASVRIECTPSAPKIVNVTISDVRIFDSFEKEEAMKALWERLGLDIRDVISSPRVVDSGPITMRLTSQGQALMAGEGSAEESSDG